MRIAVAGGRGTVGRHVVRAGEERGHEMVVISRRDGHDVVTGTGLAAALAGTDAVIDVSSVMTTSGKAAVRFFGSATGSLLDAGEAAGVAHHVALSIVGIDGVDASYYAGKLAQERMLGPTLAVRTTLLRAAQFHEFAEQVLGQASIGSLSLVPKALIRPVAAREVGARLIELAEGGPAGRAPDLVGPRDERLAELVRRMLAADGARRRVLELALPGTYWRALASGALRGTAGTPHTTGTLTFDAWLHSPDHTPTP
ncbi:SDR family oxidoreductase [Herbiconiux moechotypicola]|uniref:NAD(P)H-binding protein n=1 Tax=Herbiconiux moechotypicola TaxID=637393 RepID=A0ABP5QFM8_9MICO|nr:SDR family oxidoreductase [Herbiconiux moechotypicola]MCS5730021.1 SDR family oxidoreductase [Herbiconiux moechotypicola]